MNLRVDIIKKRVKIVKLFSYSKLKALSVKFAQNIAKLVLHTFCVIISRDITENLFHAIFYKRFFL